jgi:NitT/TauT family transport system permease protein
MMSQKNDRPLVEPRSEQAISAGPSKETPGARVDNESWLVRLFKGRRGTTIAVILFGILLLLLWEAVFRLGVVSDFIVPSAIETLKEIGRIFSNFFTGGVYFKATLVTLEEIAVGFAAAAVVGIALGIVIGETSFGRRVLMPYVVGFNAVPKVALAPLFIAALGFGVAPKMLMAAVIAVFPAIVNTAVGIESASENELRLFRAMEASRWQTLWKLKFPTSLPYVFAGLKVAAVLATIGAIVGEMLSGGAGGLGKRLDIAALNLKTDSIFAIILLLSVTGLVVYLITVVLEHYIVYWRRKKRAA